MARTHKAKCLYIALTKNDAKELIWDKLKDMFSALDIAVRFNEVALKVTMLRTGSTLRLVGADDQREIDKLRGKPHHEVGVDETAAIPPKLLESLVLRAISPRLGDFGGTIWMISTPGHVLRGLFYDATRNGSATHRPYSERNATDVNGQPVYAGWTRWSSHHWDLRDGAETVPAIALLWAEALIEKERNQWTDDNPIWRREYLGEWASDDSINVYKFRAHTETGEAWNIWNPERVGPHAFGKLPDGPDDWIYAYGMDLGHSDPMALQVLAASPTDQTRTIYQVFEFEQRGMHSKLIAELLLGTGLDSDHPAGIIGVTGWPNGIVADTTHLGPMILDELAKVYSIAAKPAEQKGKFAAIELLNGDLLEGRIKVLAGSKLAEQMGQLQWVVDQFGVLKEDKAQANHSSDAFLYARRLLATIFETQAVNVPANDNDHRGMAVNDNRIPPTTIAPPPQDEYSDFSEFNDDFAAWGNG